MTLEVRRLSVFSSFCNILTLKAVQFLGECTISIQLFKIVLKPILTAEQKASHPEWMWPRYRAYDVPPCATPSPREPRSLQRPAVWGRPAGPTAVAVLSQVCEQRPFIAPAAKATSSLTLPHWVTAHSLRRQKQPQVGSVTINCSMMGTG